MFIVFLYKAPESMLPTVLQDIVWAFCGDLRDLRHRLHKFVGLEIRIWGIVRGGPGPAQLPPCPPGPRHRKDEACAGARVPAGRAESPPQKLRRCPVELVRRAQQPEEHADPAALALCTDRHLEDLDMDGVGVSHNKDPFVCTVRLFHLP